MGAAGHLQCRRVDAWRRGKTPRLAALVKPQGAEDDERNWGAVSVLCMSSVHVGTRELCTTSRLPGRYSTLYSTDICVLHH